MADSPHIDEIRHGPITAVRLLDKRLLDEVSIGRVYAEITEAIRNDSPPLLILGFSRVEFLSSAALGILLKLRQDVKQAGGQIHLAGIRPDVREVFTITKLDSLFQFHADIEDAVAKVKTWLRLMGGENAGSRAGRV
jgi:anti-sigma B factor antagonist